jgi:peptidoglycan hydrolase-like protein with peptidoglycan-binding domain
MQRTNSIHRPLRRRLVRASAIGVCLTLIPLASSATTVQAEAPAVAVTGLSRGSRGDAVKSVQQALVNRGLTVAGGVDGVFGPGTETAVKSFQSSSGITPTGVVDDATALALGLASSDMLGLAQGNRGPAVRSLQQALVDAGIVVAGGVDGVFGPGTAAGLKTFQTTKGLTGTGVVDAATAAALGSVTASDGSSSSSADASGSTPSDAEATAPVSDSGYLGLKIGARGDAVQRMQQALLGAGFNVVGGADGIFGVLTANALSSFQNAQGFTATAVVDTQTARALEAVATSPTSGEAARSGSNSASPLAGLRYGSLGSDVRQLQRTLIDLGIRVRGGADGVFGAATQAALKEFQANRGLPRSGMVDDATAGALASSGGASGVASASPFVGLKAGSLGNSVKALQQSLIDAGVKVRGGADGIFGPATANALKAFQQSQGLSASGVVDAATVAALAAPKAPAAAPPQTGGFAAYGEKGSRVVALQTALVSAGISLRGGIDGSFGAGTSAAVMEFQRQRSLSVTGKVSDATAAALGLDRAEKPAEPDPASVTLEAFPVQGSCYYGDSWGYPRGGGRVHLGVDIIAPAGKLLYAVADGRITKVYRDYPGSLSGNAVRVTMADGTYFFYAHMSEIAEGIDVGVPVKAGQIVGYLGNTGNSGTNHLHFEIHPKGGSAINAYPLIKAIDGCGNTAPLPQP